MSCQQTTSQQKYLKETPILAPSRFEVKELILTISRRNQHYDQKYAYKTVSVTTGKNQCAGVGVCGIYKSKFVCAWDGEGAAVGCVVLGGQASKEWGDRCKVGFLLLAI